MLSRRSRISRDEGFNQFFKCLQFSVKVETEYLLMSFSCCLFPLREWSSKTESCFIHCQCTKNKVCFLFFSECAFPIFFSFRILPHGWVQMMIRSLLLNNKCSNHKVMTEKYWPFWCLRVSLVFDILKVWLAAIESQIQRGIITLEMKRKTGEAVLKVTDVSA